jgi:hypothetical protein
MVSAVDILYHFLRIHLPVGLTLNGSPVQCSGRVIISGLQARVDQTQAAGAEINPHLYAVLKLVFLDEFPTGLTTRHSGHNTVFGVGTLYSIAAAKTFDNLDVCLP